MYMTDLISLISKEIEIKVILIKKGWVKIDAKRDLLLYQNELIKNKINVFEIFK